MQLTLAFLSGSSRRFYRFVLNGHGGSISCGFKPDGKMLNGGILFIFVLIACIIISTGSFAVGYRVTGYEDVMRWIVVFGGFWLVAFWRGWRWVSALAVLLAVSLAAYGVWFEFSLNWMFSGAAFAFFAWDLTEFQQRLKRLPPRDDVDGMLRRHLIRIGLLAGGALVLTLILSLGQ